MCGSRGSGVPKADIGLVTSNGSGALSLTYDENFCRAPTPDRLGGDLQRGHQWPHFAYDCRFNLVAYLVRSNQIFLSLSMPMSCSALANRQAAVSLTNSALKGMYAGFATHPADSEWTVFSGELRRRRPQPTGNLHRHGGHRARVDRLPERRSKRPIP